VTEGRADAWRIDQNKTFGEDSRRIKKIHSVNAEFVLRVRFFRYEPEEELPNDIRVVGRDLLDFSPIRKLYLNQRMWAPRNENRHGRERNDGDWQQRRAQQGIDERALPALELPENGQLESLMLKPMSKRIDTLAKRSIARNGFG
jgi:hypothetical protein